MKYEDRFLPLTGAEFLGDLAEIFTLIDEKDYGQSGVRIHKFIGHFYNQGTSGEVDQHQRSEFISLLLVFFNKIGFQLQPYERDILSAFLFLLAQLGNIYGLGCVITFLSKVNQKVLDKKGILDSLQHICETSVQYLEQGNKRFATALLERSLENSSVVLEFAKSLQEEWL